MEIAPIIIAIIAVVGSVTSVVIQVRRDRHKVGADAASTYEDLTAKQAQRISEQEQRMDTLKRDYESRLAKLETAVDEQGKEISILYAGLELLTNQLKAEGFTPIWKPKKRQVEA